MLDTNEIKKDLYKSKNMAKFSHYVSGNLYYQVDLVDGTYQFPIETTEKVIRYELGDEEGDDEIMFEDLILSEDLGTTTFSAEIRGSELARWISKAIKAETFIKIV